MGILSSRQIAKESKSKRYFTGNPCPHGHICERFTSSGCCVSCTGESYKKWSQSNKKKRNSGIRNWRLANPQKLKESLTKYYNKNPQKFHEHRRNRRARKLNAVGSHTHDDIMAIMRKQKCKCVSCKKRISFIPQGQQLKAHVDHISPLFRGGANDKTNLQILCWECNLSKGSKDPIKWAQEKGRLL